MSLKGKSRQYPKDKSHPFIVRDNNKCILCAQCVRACREISGTENLGLFGRGFGTVPMSAFDLPLNESKCISCGACVNVCPTGAITAKTPAVKNPPLPFEEERYVCDICSRNCVFTKRSVNGKTVKMIPENLSECCSLGLFLLPVRENLPDNISEEQFKAICDRLCGSLSKYEGDNVNVRALIEEMR